MKIIIAGCGKVGFAIAQQLDEEGHDITIIDTDREVLEATVSKLDVQGIEGQATSYLTQKEAGIQDSDLFIAMTGMDEVNLLACLIAKKAGGCRTIARVRNPEYDDEIKYLKEELGMSMSVNPELACAMEITRLIQIPSALEVNTFAKGRVNMVKLTVAANSPLADLRIKDFGSTISSDILVCIIERGQDVIIPKGNTLIKEGDKVYIVAPLAKMNTLFIKTGAFTKSINSIMIAGGGTLGYYLARMLINLKKEVIIIERNRERCLELSEKLPEARIICGDASDREVLLEEGIKDVEAFVSLTNYDEENILLSMYATKVSKAKLITKINKISFQEVVGEGIPLGTIACPKNITRDSIVSYVRSLDNSLGSNVETLYKLVDNKVEALEFVINDKASQLTGKPIMELKLKDELLLCSINRNGKIITPSGKDTIENGDTVIVVTTIKGLTDVKDILK